MKRLYRKFMIPEEPCVGILEKMVSSIVHNVLMKGF
jgi:hypothetical protein